MPEVPNLPTAHRAGQPLKAISASAVNALMRFVNELEAGGAVVIEKEADGRCRIAVWLSDTDFDIDATTGVIGTNGATGTTLNGDVIENGLIKTIGT